MSEVDQAQEETFLPKRKKKKVRILSGLRQERATSSTPASEQEAD